MHPEEKAPFRIGGATLTNAASYPTSPAKIDRMLKDCGEGNTVRAFFGGAATFGTATLQMQLSFDGGATWVNYGAAITSAAPVVIEVPRCALIRFLVGGTGDITVAALYLA